jgi:Tfp pilus assembly protein PilX
VRRASPERGSALIIAMLAMTIMMGLGFAALTFVDGQQRDSAQTRVADSAFNLAEGVLDTQVYLLSHRFPGSAGTARPASCTQATAVVGCPDPVQVGKSFVSGDGAAGATWSTMVRDNGGQAASFYSDAVAAGQPTWDANHDGRVWARAEAIVAGRRRAVVALVEVQRIDSSLLFSRNVITSGWFQTSNNGKKVIVDTQGSSAQPAPVAVRCLVRVPSCLDYQASKGQISPDTTTTGYAGGNALTADRLDTLRARAIADGTHYASGCPANPSGTVVVIENGNCSYNNSVGACCNSAAAPGVLVVVNGTFSLGGNIVYRGIVYLANQQNSLGVVLSLGGTSGIDGAVAVDGTGGVSAGSSGVNITFASSVFNTVVGYGTAGVIQNTWRELTGV